MQCFSCSGRKTVYSWSVWSSSSGEKEYLTSLCICGLPIRVVPLAQKPYYVLHTHQQLRYYLPVGLKWVIVALHLLKVRPIAKIMQIHMCTNSSVCGAPQLKILLAWSLSFLFSVSPKSQWIDNFCSSTVYTEVLFSPYFLYWEVQSLYVRWLIVGVGGGSANLEWLKIGFVRWFIWGKKRFLLMSLYVSFPSVLTRRTPFLCWTLATKYWSSLSVYDCPVSWASSNSLIVLKVAIIHRTLFIANVVIL